jgi:hypothetical protein
VVEDADHRRRHVEGRRDLLARQLAVVHHRRLGHRAARRLPFQAAEEDRRLVGVVHPAVPGVVLGREALLIFGLEVLIGAEGTRAIAAVLERRHAEALRGVLDRQRVAQRLQRREPERLVVGVVEGGVVRPARDGRPRSLARGRFPVAVIPVAVDGEVARADMRRQDARRAIAVQLPP